jgi:hypothetical protein
MAPVLLLLMMAVALSVLLYRYLKSATELHEGWHGGFGGMMIPVVHLKNGLDDDG